MCHIDDHTLHSAGPVVGSNCDPINGLTFIDHWTNAVCNALILPAISNCGPCTGSVLPNVLISNNLGNGGHTVCLAVDSMVASGSAI